MFLALLTGRDIGGIISRNRYPQVHNPLLTGRDFGSNNLREQIPSGS
jgi:hypothetical protein